MNTAAIDSMPAVIAAPAPWTLAGQGYLFVLSMPPQVLASGSFIPPGMQRSSRGRLAYAMFVDYARSDAGPYRELLYIPGALRFGEQSRLSITRIYVSTWESVVNGRRNWGIPKDRCDFAVDYGDEVDRIRLGAADGPPIAEMELESFGPRLPAPGHWTPRSWRTLSQDYEGRRFTYVPEARGHVRFARVRRWQFDPHSFPDLARGRLLAALKVTDFQMIFPVSNIQMLATA